MIEDLRADGDDLKEDLLHMRRALLSKEKRSYMGSLPALLCIRAVGPLFNDASDYLMVTIMVLGV